MILLFPSFVLMGFIYNLSLQGHDINHKALKTDQNQSVTIFLAGDVMTGRGIIYKVKGWNLNKSQMLVSICLPVL